MSSGCFSTCAAGVPPFDAVVGVNHPAAEVQLEWVASEGSGRRKSPFLVRCCTLPRLLGANVSVVPHGLVRAPHPACFVRTCARPRSFFASVLEGERVDPRRVSCFLKWCAFHDSISAPRVCALRKCRRCQRVATTTRVVPPSFDVVATHKGRAPDMNWFMVRVLELDRTTQVLR